jgi:carbon storage regulator
MLVLSRRKDESIVIGKAIKLTVVEIRGDKMRLGIECPKAIPVHREEVVAAIGASPMDQTEFDALANGALDSNLMLVLSRKMFEAVVIGGGVVRATVIEIRGDKVRLGIEVPRELPLHRAEVFGS